MLRIAIDIMGGDNGSSPILEGVLQALKERKFKAILVGKKSEIIASIPQEFIGMVEIVEADDVISMSDSSTDALKRKESSIYKAIELVKEGKADGVVSAGHSGATMSLATLRIGRLKGVSRPAIATWMPTTSDNKKTLVLDVGANVDCKALHLYHFAIMGESYAKDVMKVKSPKIGLLSNGEESSKGNEVTKETFTLLKNMSGFVGNVEGNNIFDGSVDVVVCDGFIGNIVLKTSEGVSKTIKDFVKLHIKKSPFAIAGAVLMRKVFELLKKKVDYAEYGGAPLLGINGCVIISHGKSNAKALKNAIFQAINYINANVTQNIESAISKSQDYKG